MNQQSAGEMLKGKCPIIFMHERDGSLPPQSVRQKYRRSVRSSVQSKCTSKPTQIPGQKRKSQTEMLTRDGIY